MQTESRTTQARTATASLDRELVIARTFDAPRSLVFKAWTERDRIWQWLGPKGFTTLLFESDPRPGGAWRARMRSPEGKELAQYGVVRVISPPERFVFSQAWADDPEHETLVTIVLSERDGTTTMSFHQGIFETVEARDSHEDGWNESLDRLEEYLATARER